jgi:serine/threonine protein kinase
MQTTFDAAGIGELAVRLGLVSDAQVRECLAELDDKKAPAEDLVRLLERKGYLTPLQGGKLLKGDTAGYILGGYRLLYKIASGSFGRVYRGDDPRTGQTVAIKVLRNKWSQDKQKVDLFLREGKLGMTIRHANIVSVLAVSQDPKTGHYFIVMEFVEGGTLRDILGIRKKLVPDEALRIMEECAAGLAYAHTRGLTHRDIKATNILIAAQGQAKLVDFGLAELSQGSAAMFLGRQDDKDKDEDVMVDRTVDYAGLEKATSQKPGDVRSDIFFLGTVLFEMVTGVPLMPVTKDRQARMQARRYEEVELNLRKLAPEHQLPIPLMKLIAKMVAFDPAERVQNPTQLVDLIRNCRADLSGNPELATRSRVPTGQKTVFVLETNEKLKEAFRERFKEQGYRVLLSLDPAMPVSRYRQQPYHALLVDARTIGRDGVDAFTRVLREADSVGLDVGAVLILGKDQSHYAPNTSHYPNAVVLTDDKSTPITMKHLLTAMHEVAPNGAGPPPSDVG